MSSADVFGPVFVPQVIEGKTKAMLIKWMPDYLHEAEDQLGLATDSIKVPAEKNYTSRNSFDALPGDAIPKVVVISPGIIGTPAKTGDGRIRATWRLGIGLATAAQDEETAKFDCDIYGACVRIIMLQQGGKELGAKVHYLDEQYIDLPIPDQLKQYRAASLWFSVDIENIAKSRGGPLEPNSGPYGYTTADTVDVQLTKEPLDE